MSNRRMLLSEEGKQILDKVVNILEIERPMGVKLALAKGLSVSKGPVDEDYSGKNKWTIPDNIIKDKEFLLFKHLIVNEVNSSLNDEELHKYMIVYIEIGVRELEQNLNGKSSMEDFRLCIL